jgi:hypothetical protein
LLDGAHPTTAASEMVAMAMAAEVPEPQTHALMVFGLAGLALISRRRRRGH